MSKEHRTVPPSIAATCGLFAGATAGWGAAKAISDLAMQGLGDNGNSTLEHVIEIGGALAGAYVGNALALEKPLEGVFLALAVAPNVTHLVQHHSESAAVNEIAPLPDQTVAPSCCDPSFPAHDATTAVVTDDAGGHSMFEAGVHSM